MPLVEPMHELAVLFAFDDVAFLRSCEATILSLRHGAGNFTGPIEVVGPEGLRFSKHLAVRTRTLAEVVAGSSVPLLPPRHCSSLNSKRAEGWAGYYFKALSSMSSFWASRYRRLIFMDCGMQVHSSLQPLLEFEPGPRIAAHSACYPEFISGMENVIHPECGQATAEALMHAYPKAAKADYFQSTLMVYPTAMLGPSNRALHEIADLYHRFGAVVEGDQELLSLYWIHNRSAARTLPLQGPHCLYDYLPRKPHPHNCRSFVLTKLSYMQALKILGNSWKRGRTVQGVLHKGIFMSSAAAAKQAAADQAGKRWATRRGLSLPRAAFSGRRNNSTRRRRHAITTTSSSTSPETLRKKTWLRR